MTRLSKVKKLEERIAPSMFAFGSSTNFSGSASGDVNGHSLDSHAAANANANANASASVGWINPLLLRAALLQHGLVDASANIDTSGNIAY